MTPRRASSDVIDARRLKARRILNDPVFCRFSGFRKIWLPTRRSNVSLLKSGVGLIMAARRRRARSISPISISHELFQTRGEPVESYELCLLPQPSRLIALGFARALAAAQCLGLIGSAVVRLMPSHSAVRFTLGTKCCSRLAPSSSPSNSICRQIPLW